ncbi:hypothetical protein FHG87_009967 [Trinorchestia longiramus]|nr:hypothetical protein FHG87_009967 [Trinorchestia longiramus]
MYSEQLKPLQGQISHHQLGRLLSESACEREDPGSNPAADMVDAARNTAWDLGKQPNNYRSNYPTQEWARSYPRSSEREGAEQAFSFGLNSAYDAHRHILAAA